MEKFGEYYAITHVYLGYVGFFPTENRVAMGDWALRVIRKGGKSGY